MKKEEIGGSMAAFPAPYFATKAGKLLFVAMGAQGKTVEEAAEGFYGQLKRVLEGAGSSLENILQMTTYWVNMNDAVKARAARAKYFTKDTLIASVGVQIGQLFKMDPPLQFEAQLVAVIPGG